MNPKILVVLCPVSVGQALHGVRCCAHRAVALVIAEVDDAIEGLEVSRAVFLERVEERQGHVGAA